MCALPRAHLRRALQLLALLMLLGVALPPSTLRAQPCQQPATAGCPLGFGQPVAGVIQDADEAHLWRLTMPASGYFALLLANLPAPYRIYVYGPDRTLIAQSSNPGAEDEFVEVDALLPGEYQVYVDTPLGETSPEPYILLPIRQLDVGQTTSSSLELPYPINMWLVDVEPDAVFRIVLSELQADYDIYLYSLNGNLVSQSTNGGTRDDVIQVQGLEPGRYVIGVFPDDADEVGYPYRLSLLSGAPPPIAAVSPTPIPPTPVPATVTPLPPSPTPGVTPVPASVTATSVRLPTNRTDSLTDQTLRVCTIYEVPFELSGTRGVEFENDLVMVVAQATNIGRESEDLYLAVKLRDEQDRLFEMRSSRENPVYTDIVNGLRAQGATLSAYNDDIQPGQSANVLLMFQVAPDSRALKLVPNRLDCFNR